MRTILASCLLVALTGCTAPGTAERSAGASPRHPTPVRYEPPTLSARAREAQRRQAELDRKEDQSVTLIEGNIVR